MPHPIFLGRPPKSLWYQPPKGEMTTNDDISGPFPDWNRCESIG